MKKFISVILLLCAMLGALTACSVKNGDGEISQIPVNDAQLDKIASFGITYKTQRIVVYAHANNYVKYVVADYENEKKTAECSYYFYNNEEAYGKAKAELKGTTAQFDDSAWLVSLGEGLAAYGKFEADLELLGKDYTVKYRTEESTTALN